MKLPKAKQKDNGKWLIQVMIDGKRVGKEFETEDEALYWAAGLKTNQKEYKKEPLQISVNAAIDRFIEMNDGIFSPSTIRGYRVIQKNRLGQIENKLLVQLNDEVLQRWVNYLSKKYAAKTVWNSYGLIHDVLSVYYKSYHPSVKLPQKEKEEIKIPTEDELQLILKTASGTKYELPILIACWLGLRESEIVGLKWSQIENDFLTVNSAVVIGEKNVAYEKGPKTPSGSRRIRIPKYIMEKINNLPKNGDRLFNMSGHSIYMGFVRICKKAGVDHYRFHDLRHVNASAMLLTGAPIKHIVNRMGHKTDSMVKKVYGHVFRNREESYDDMIDTELEKMLTTK